MPYHPMYNTRISREEAIQIALQQVRGRVFKAELDTENGRWVYEIGIRVNYAVYEVTVDATTGQIISIDYD